MLASTRVRTGEVATEPWRNGGGVTRALIYPAMSFAGDFTTRCRSIDGPARDLNLVLRGVGGKLRRDAPGAWWRPRARKCSLYEIAAGHCRRVGHTDAEQMPAAALRWWSAAPDVLAFDAAGGWLSAGTAAAP